MMPLTIQQVGPCPLSSASIMSVLFLSGLAEYEGLNLKHWQWKLIVGSQFASFGAEQGPPDMF